MAGVLGAGILLSLGEHVAGISAGLLVTGACLCWGLDNNFTALIDGITPAQSTFWKGLAAGSVNLAIGLVTRDFSGTVTATVAALGVGIFCYGASIVLYITAAQNIGATRGQMFFAASPFFGVILSVALLGEPVTVVQLIAGVILAASLCLVSRDTHGHGHAHEEQEHEHGHRQHKHEPMTHRHPHWPDLHHRHGHK